MLLRNPSLGRQQALEPLTMTSPVSTPLLRAALVLGLALVLPTACTEDPKPAAAKADTTDASDAVPPADADGSSAGSDAELPDVIPDTAQPDSTDAEDAKSDMAETAGDADTAAEIAQCATASDCTELLTLPACQQAACEAGQCKAAPKPLPFCCNDAACDDKDECTNDACDAATKQCKNQVDPKCCTGKQTMFKTSFEAASLGDLKVTDGASNGNVGWTQATTRAHSGNAALYFGNACKTYDNSMTSDGGCKPGKDATPVSTTLTTGEFLLPPGTTAQIHFWLWLDTEPPHTTAFPAGTCKSACPSTSSCVLVNGEAQCLPEKDLFTVNLVQSNKTTQLFSSLSIGKTTGGKWKQVALDLSAFGGSAAKLQWQFATATGLKNQHEGIYLDDVVIETVCAQNACSPSSPCADDANACTADPCSAYANGNSGAGACLYSAIPGCCAEDKDCTDNNSCTIDSCKNGQCAFTPDASKPTCCKASVPFGDDFDGGSIAASGWTAMEQNSTEVQWRLLSSGTGGALAFSNEGGTSYQDSTLGEDVGPKGTLCTPSMTLKEGTLYNLLTFQLKLDTEWSGGDPKAYKNPPVEGLTKYDTFGVQVLADSQFYPVWNSDAVYGTTAGKWQPITISLAPWAGKKVQVCLQFDAGDGSKNDYAGAWIEDLAVKVACSKQSCYLNSECAAKTCAACETASCGASAGCICAKIPGCCGKDADCDDKDACTADSCSNATCKNAKIDGCTP